MDKHHVARTRKDCQGYVWPLQMRGSSTGVHKARIIARNLQGLVLLCRRDLAIQWRLTAGACHTEQIRDCGYVGNLHSAVRTPLGFNGDLKFSGSIGERGPAHPRKRPWPFEKASTVVA